MMMSSPQPTAHQPASLSDHTLAAGESREVIKSRFGDIVIDTRNALIFPKGMLGMPDCRNFALASFPSEKMQQFKLLQCLDDLSISFITLPLPVESTIIQRQDALVAAREQGVSEEGLVVLLIVCVHRMPDSTRLSVNARAPVLLDATRKTGVQHVFTQDYYKVQHYIT